MITMTRKVYLLFFLFSSLKAAEVASHDNAVLENKCDLKDGSKGICKFIGECKYAIEDLKNNILPNFCNLDQGIVCCVFNKTVSTPITKLNTTGTSNVTKPHIERQAGDKANEMCKSYSRHAYKPVEAHGSSNNLTTLPPILDCQIYRPKGSFFIFGAGGTDAELKEFPHMVHVGFEVGTKIDWLCSGSVISENFVLTAAHCLKHNGKNAKLVRGGMVNQSDTEHHQIRNVVKVIKHPNYTQKYHDIGLLKVDKNFNFNAFLRPACLYTKDILPRKGPLGTGWGLTGYFERNNSEILQKVEFEFYTAERCNFTYKRHIAGNELPFGIVEDYMICAGSKNHHRDMCPGDSGGPLQTVRDVTEDVKCMYDIVGVTSFGMPCALFKDTPGVYTRVSYYIKWIEDIVWGEK